MNKIPDNGPIEPLKFSLFRNNNIDILRDDLIHPLVSGNKWRKLRYFIEEVKKQDKSKIVTFGGAYSNHLVATAVAGNLFGINTYAFVRGDDERPLNHYEEICIKNNMQLRHVSRAAYKDKMALFENDFANDDGAIFLDEGGDHPLAVMGCSRIIDELELEYDYIILAVGTGTTIEGLVKGVSEKKLKTCVLGISSMKNNFSLDTRLEKYDRKNWRMFHEYHRGKYASTDQELINFISAFKIETGIQTESVYTGKMLMALEELLNIGFIGSGDKVLVIHTGGVLNQ